ncbi:MAG: hypothetical protein A2X46_08145 [Lentisphaerae bacterium GWF2_57_35]|nr:MAG: hypothetical protein A2X46_08145 [Lentisphaerae bacterium GWF2_57_35]
MLAALSGALVVGLMFTSHADTGFWKQYAIVNWGGSDVYHGNPMSSGFNGVDLGSTALGSVFLLDGGEANTYENSGDWVTDARMFYRITNALYGTESWNQATLGGGSLSGVDRKWETTDLGRKLSTNAPGTYYIEMYFQAQGNWSGGDWQFNDSATPDYKAFFTITNLPWAIDCWVTNNAGPESMTVNWTRPGSYNVMVVRRLGDWPDAPDNGTSYTNKQTYGADDRNVVIYASGSGSSTMDRELIPNTASNYYYAFYTENFSYYSAVTGVVYAGRSMDTNTPAFRPGEVVDSFAYFAPQDITAAISRGTNWSGAWTWAEGALDIQAGSLTPAVNYPAAWGNKFHAGPNVVSYHGCRRDLLTPFTTGAFYLGFVYRPGSTGANKWSGMSISDGSTEKAMIGLPGGETAAGVEKTTGGTRALSSYNVSTVGDNTIIAKYDFSTHTLSMQAYYQTDTIPLTEPSSWGSSLDLGAGFITSINRVLFNAGGWDGGDAGDVYWDEVRIARTWKELLNQIEPVWVGGGANNSWSTPANWSANTVPGEGTNVVFADAWTSGTGINLDSARTVQGLRFNDSADADLTISNNALTIGAAGLALSSGSDGSHKIRSAVALGAGQTWTNESTQDLVVTGIVSGAYMLRKQGAGRVTLAANNTFNGNLWVDSGVMRVEGHYNSMGGGDVYVGTNATLELNNGIYWGNNDFVLHGTGTNEAAGAIRNISTGTITVPGNITLEEDSKIRVDAGTFQTRGNIDAGAHTLYITNDTSFSMTYNYLSGTKIGGDGALHKTGEGYMLLRPSGAGLHGDIVLAQGEIRHSMNDIYGGGTLYLNSGTTYRTDAGTARNLRRNVQINGDITLGHANGGAINVYSNVNLSGGARGITIPNTNTFYSRVSDGGLIKKGSGQLLLSSSNAFDSGLWIEEGKVRVGHAAAYGAHPVSIGTNACLELNAAALNSVTVEVYSAGLSENYGAIYQTRNSTIYWPASIILHGDSRLTAAYGTLYITNGPLDLGGNTLDLNVLNGTLILKEDEASCPILNAYKRTGNGAIYKSGFGSLLIRPQASMTGDIYVAEGHLRQYSEVPFPAGGTMHFSNGVYYMSTVTSGGTVTTNHMALSIEGDVTLGYSSWTRPLALTGPVNLNGGVRILATGGDHILSGNMTNGGLVKSGGITSKLLLLGTNSYGDGTVVSAGHLEGHTASLQGSISNDTMLTFRQDTDGTYSGTLSGGGIVAKAGDGEVTFSGDNALFTGPIIVSNGVLKITHANALGDASGFTTVANGYSLRLQGGISTHPEPLTMRGDGYYGGGALDNVSGNNTFGGPITLQANTRIRVQADTLTLTNAIVGPTFTLEACGGGTLRIDSPLDMLTSGGISKIDAGTLILTATSTNSGNTTVTAGTLIQNGTNAVSAVTVGALATLMGAGQAANVTVSGLLRPGPSTTGIGRLRVASLTMNGGSALRAKIGDCTDTTDRDYVLNDGSATINATVTVYPDSSLAANWNNTQDHSWILIQGGVSSIDNFALNETYWTLPKSGGAFALSLAGSDLVLTFTAGDAPDIALLGINLAIIPNGDSNPESEDGTDFGHLHVDTGGSLMHTFVITNGGTQNLTVEEVAIGGAGAADFTVTSQPLLTVMPDSFTSFQVEFDPSLPGIRSATIYITNNVDGKNPYTFDIQGIGDWPGIQATPPSIVKSMTLGFPISDGNFGVTNVGYGTMSYSISTNVEWITVTPVSGSLEHGEGQQHTVAFNRGCLDSGSYTGTITIADATASNNPQVVTVVMTLNSIANPNPVSVVADGNELVRLAWTPYNASFYRTMIVHREGAMPTPPSHCQAYNVGDSCGGGAVIWKDYPNGTNYDHEVASGQTHYYGFYTIIGSHYSTGIYGQATLGSYNGVITEPFPYTNGVSLDGLNQGSGWTNAWSVASGAWSITNWHAAPGFRSMPYYPSNAAYRVRLADPGDGNEGAASRFFAPVNVGCIYVAAIMSYQYKGVQKWAGIELMSNGVGKAFAGKPWDGTQETRFGLDAEGSVTLSGSRELNSYDVVDGDTGNVYLVIMKYDFSSRALSGIAYYRTNQVPGLEPGTWDATRTLAAGYMDSINGVRIKAGSSAGNGAIGDVHFDEIRVATSWSDLLNPPPPKVIYDWFANASGRLANQGGGSGWGANNWQCDDNDNHVYDSGSFSASYWSCPPPVSHKVKLVATENGSVRYATRTFGTNFTSGKVYFSWMQNFDHAGGANSAYAGLYIMSNNQELAFIGKVPGADTMGLRWMGSTSDTNSSRQVSNGTGHDYLFVARYDFATRELCANVYATNECVAEEPVGYWDVTTTLEAGHIDQLNGIRIKGGVDSDPANNIGNVYFDEIRVGTNWYEVARRDGEDYAPDMILGPTPKLLYVGTNYNTDDNPQGSSADITITDAELFNASDPLDFAVSWANVFGVWMTNSDGTFNLSSREGNVSPNWDPVRKVGEDSTEIGYDAFFTNFVGINGAETVTTYVHRAFNITNATIDDTFYLSVSAENMNPAGGGFAAPNGADDVQYHRALTVNTTLQFYVQDDDAAAPVNGPFTPTNRYLLNADFEQTNDCWSRQTSWLNAAGAAPGEGITNSMAMRLRILDDWGTYFIQGFEVEHPVVGGQLMVATVWARSQSLIPAGGTITMTFRLFDWPLGETNTASINLLNEGLTTSWKPFRVYCWAPALATHGRVEFDLNSAWSGGYVYYDNISVCLASEYTPELDVYLGSNKLSRGNAIEPLYRLTDAQLAEVDAAKPLRLSLGAYDLYSGLAHALDGFVTNITTLSIANYITNDHSLYQANESSANTIQPGATNVWRIDGISQDSIESLYQATSNRISVNYWDTDNDRFSDQLGQSNVSLGAFYVTDEDVLPPDFVGSNLFANAAFSTPIPGYPVGFDVWTYNNWDTDAGSDGNPQYGRHVRTPTGGWHVEGSTLVAHTYESVWQQVSATQNLVYIMKVDCRADIIPVSNINVYMKLEARGASGLIGTNEIRIQDSLTPSWQTYTHSILAPSNTTAIRGVFGYSGNAGGLITNVLRWDNAYLAAGNNPLKIMLGGTNISRYDQEWTFIEGGSYAVGDRIWTNAVYVMTDQDLSTVSPANALQLHIGVSDVGSGVLRGDSIPTRTMTLSFENFITNNYEAFKLEYSTPEELTTGPSTSIWEFLSFDSDQINAVIGRTNRISCKVSDMDDDRTGIDWLVETNKQLGFLHVYDDDAAPPSVSNLVVLMGDQAAPLIEGANTSNVVYRVTDGDLANAGATPVSLSFNVHDPVSGIPRNTVGVETNMSVTVEALTVNNVANYVAFPVSTMDTKANNSTSLWTWSVNLDESAVSNLYGDTSDTSTGSWRKVTANIPDADSDRLGDTAWRSNAQFGFIWVCDDDTNAPTHGVMRAGNVLRNSRFEEPGFGPLQARYWNWDYPNQYGSYWGTATREAWGSYPADEGSYVATVRGTWAEGDDTTGGFWQQVTNAWAAGMPWEAWAWCQSDFSPLAGALFLQIEFYNGAGTLITARTNVFADPGAPWTYVSVTATSPANCAYVRWVMGADDVGATGALKFDEAGLSPVTNAAMNLLIGGSGVLIEGSGTNTFYEVTDEQLANVSATNRVDFIFNVYDPTSGVARSAVSEDLNFDVGGIAEMQNQYATYSSARSSADATDAGSTSVFSFADGFTKTWLAAPGVETGLIHQLMGNTDSIYLSAPNDDTDRGGVDREWMIDHQVGYLRVIDDDTNGPNMWLTYAGSEYTDGATSDATVTDEEMLGGLDLALGLWDYSGVFLTNQTAAATNSDGALGNISPNMDLVTPDGTQVVQDRIFGETELASPAGNGSLHATGVVQNLSQVTYDANTVGVWQVRMSMQDYDNDRGAYTQDHDGHTHAVPFDRANTIDYGVELTVVDDDEVAPVKRTFNDSSWGVGMAANYFIVATNGTIVTSRSSSSTNVHFTVTDGYLAGLDPAHNIQFVFGALDAYSGLSRALDGIGTNAYMNFSIGSVLSGVITGYDETASSVNTPNAVMTNVWTFDDHVVFTRDVISNLVCTPGVSNRVTVTVPDADNDRVNDRMAYYNDVVGWFSVIDDDTTGPVLSSVRFNGGRSNVTDGSLAANGFSLTGLVQDVKGVLGTNYPTLQLFNPLTLLSGTEYMTNPLIADGSGRTPTPTSIGRTNVPVAFDDRVLGSWTAIVYAADADDDGWGLGDRTSTTTNYVFQVIDDDVYAPNIIGAKLGAGSGGLGAANLIISEYIEGSSFNKYIEIFNGTDASVDMTDYSLAIYYGGAAEPTGVDNPFSLSGTLAPGAVYVAANSSAAGWSGVPDLTHGQCNFNGDDVVALLHSGATVDVVGVIGSTDYPGADVTLVRKTSVLNPTTVYDPDEWEAFPIDTFSILGSHNGPVTDGDLRSGDLVITGRVQDASGIYVTQAAPRYGIFNPEGVECVSDQSFAQQPAADGAGVVPEPLADSVPVIPYDQVTLGLYTALVFATDYDVDRPSDSITGISEVVFTVVDDDTNKPVVHSSLGTRLRNSSFEIQGSSVYKAYAWDAGVPDGNGNGWGTASRESWRARSGTYEMALNAWSEGTNAGLWQQVANTTPEGTIWNLSAWFWSDDGVAGGPGLYVWTSTVSEIKIEFFDSDFALLDSVSEAFPEPGETWTQVSVSRAAPADAAWARAVVAAWDMGSAGSALGGALQFDDVMFGPTPPLAVKIGSSFVPGSDNTSNAVFTLLDSEIGTNSLRLLFGAYDAKSGLSRGTSSATTQMNVSVDGLAVDNVDRYVVGESTADSTAEGAVSVWKWELSGVEINAMIAAGSNEVLSTVFDADDDRAGDRLAISNQLYGYLQMIDDDTNAPIARNLTIKNGVQVYDGDIRFGLWNIGMVLEDYSEVATTTAGEYTAPNYSLVNSIGQMVHTDIGWTYLNKLADSNVWSLGRAAPGVAYADVTTGLYAIVWSAMDKDNDRPGDPMQALNSTNFFNGTNVFLVLDDDVDIPTSPSNIVLAPLGWTNVNSFVLAFDPARDASGIFEYRVSTNAAEPTLVVHGEPLPATYVTSSAPVSISNASFEVGSDELSMPYDPFSTNNWRSFSSDGAELNFAGEEGGEDGLLASRHIIAAGTLSDGAPRYTLCSQDVYLSNSNRLRPYVAFNGYFLGNLSHVGAGGNCGAAFLKAEGFNAASNRTWIVANEWNEDHNGAPLAGVNASTWTHAALTVTNASADTEFIRFSCGLSGHSSALAYTGYWDNLSATVSVQTIGGVIYTNAPNGITTNWFFAVDDDDDRLNDRLKSYNTNFVIMFDGIAPTQVMNMAASPGLVDDTSEIDLTWSKPNDGGGNGADPLSPWWSYKVYYTDDGSAPTTNSPSYTLVDNPALSNRLTEAVTLSNFTFGIDYNIAVAGVDAAGNEGPMTAPINVLLNGFFVTQGVAKIENAVGRADISWTAATDGQGFVTREYDLIYQDASGFSDSLSNRWNLLQRDFASRLSDTGNVALGRVPPLELGNNMRFYRAAQKDRWSIGSTRRIASEEVYVLKTISLQPGNNWVSFPGIPDTCTVARVFGHNLPAGDAAFRSTQISWFNYGPNAGATQTVWLAAGEPPQWQKDNDPGDDVVVPLNQGVVVYIPTNLPAQKAIFIGRVPTNAMTQTIKGGTSKNASFNLTSFGVPTMAHPSGMNLLTSGFKGGAKPSQSDKLMKYNRITQQISGAGLWYKTTDSTWREATGINGPVIGYNYFSPDDGILIVSVNTNDWVWTNSFPYSLPTRFMSP